MLIRVNTLNDKDLRLRVIIICLFLAAGFLCCGVRLADLQLVNGEDYRQQSENRLIRAYTGPKTAEQTSIGTSANSIS